MSSHVYEDYREFRSRVPLKNICVDSSKNKGWKVFEAGPKTVPTPLIFLPPVCGTADVYFKQLLALGDKGYRVISAEFPSSYWNVKDWCLGFKQLLDYMCLDKIHLFGASLGGFLAQKFVEYTAHCPRVVSLFLCNTFIDTEIFDRVESCSFFWMFPMFLLKRMVHPSLVTKSQDPDIIKAVAFVAEQLNCLTQADLASRLTLNCASSHVNADNMRGLCAVTIMDVFDEYALSSPIKEEVYTLYPQAKLAQLKSGGNFPYLSRYEEVNIHLQIHLRRFEDTQYNALKINNE